MMKPDWEDLTSWERILARAMVPLADDLRLLDLEHLVALGGDRKSGNVESLVSSSIEIAFQPGTVRFVRVSGIDLAWDRRPRLSIDLELRHSEINVYFQLHLELLTAAVEIDYLRFSDPSPIAIVNTAKLAHCLAVAKRESINRYDPSELAPVSPPLGRTDMG